jgi:hypothetical protein
MHGRNRKREGNQKLGCGLFAPQQGVILNYNLKLAEAIMEWGPASSEEIW